MKYITGLLISIALLMSAPLTQAAVPSIAIGGLNGAAHWLWVEAEDYSYITQGERDFVYFPNLSGFTLDQPFPYNCVSQAWSTAAPVIDWQIYVPAQMSSNTKLLVQCGSHYGTGVGVKIDGAHAATLAPLPIAQWGRVAGWAQTSMPAISAGNHVIRFIDEGGYELYGWDGFLLYDGNISVTGHPNTVSYGAVSWMGANMTPNTLPVINAASVTPSFSVTNAVGVAYWINKDGVTSVYTPGTPINSPGVYRIWVEAWGSVWSQNPAIAQERTIAGADFILVNNAANVKLEPDGKTVTIPRALVSAVFPNFFYVQTEDRSYGIRVNGSPQGIIRSSIVSVTGTLQTNSDDERYIDSASVTLMGSGDVKPVGLNCSALGGEDFHYSEIVPKTGQRGVADGKGLNNIGLLVRLCGRLSPVDSSRSVLSDGSGAEVSIVAPFGQSFPELVAPYPYVALTGISSCEKDSSTGELKRVLRLASLEDIQWLTQYRNDAIAVFEPDVYLSAGDGSTSTTPANIGGYIRFVLFNEGAESNRITDVLINGVSLNSAFVERALDSKDHSLYSTRLAPGGVPQQLMNAGDPIWYRILPMDGPDTTNTQVLVRLRYVPSQPVTIAARRADGTVRQATVSSFSSTMPRFGLVTVNSARNVIYAYIVLPSSAGSADVSSVFLDGMDVTRQSSTLSGFSISGVLPLSISVQPALVEGSYHILECILNDGKKLITTFRANNGFATAMYGHNNASVAQGTWKSLMLKSSVGLLDAVGKQWDVKIGKLGSMMQYGSRIVSSKSSGYSLAIRLLPASSPNGGGVSIEASIGGSVTSAMAQYVDGPDGDWIKPDELQDGDVLSFRCANKTGSTYSYTAYLNGRQLMWWSGAASPKQSTFTMPVELDQPGLISYTNTPDFTVDSFTLLPDAKSAAFATAFDTPYLLDYHLEESEAGTWTVQNGACYHTKKSTRYYGRTYVRTSRTDYNTGDWSYEVTFNRYSQSPQDYKYIGIGDGNPSADYYGLPIGVYFGPDVSANGPMNVYRYNGVPGQNAQLVGSCGNFPGWGNERVRITKTGNILKFEVDFNYAGGAFVPDGSAVTVDLSDPYYSFFNDSNSRLFFGCTEANNNWFDDMTVTSSISGPPFVDDFTQDMVADLYTSVGDITAPWVVDTTSPGTLSFETAASYKTFFGDLKAHYIDAWLSYSPIRLVQNLADQHGVRLHPNVQDMSLADTLSLAQQVYSSNTDLYSYWLFDEPDVFDHYVGLDWGIGGTTQWTSLRLGLHAQYLVKQADLLRAGDPKHSTLLNTDCTYTPSNYFIYGQLADIASEDYYYTMNAGDTNWDPISLVYGRTKLHRGASMPNPILTFLIAGPFPDTNSRAPFPGEERITAYAALGGGANGLYYFWYHPDPIYGCQYQTELWEEIGKINREFKLLSQYIGICFPISLSATKPEKIWVRTVATGPDTLICVVINQNFVSAPTSFTYTPVSSATVSLTLPSGFNIGSAVTIDSTGPRSLPYTVQSGSVVFDAGPMEVGRIIVFSKDTGVLGQLQSKWQAQEGM